MHLMVELAQLGTLPPKAECAASWWHLPCRTINYFEHCTYSKRLHLHWLEGSDWRRFCCWHVCDSGSTSTSYLFYAQWQAVPYTMSFNSNGGETANASQITNIGQSFTFPSPGERTGYIFNGWIRGDIQNSPTYGIGTSFVTGTTGVNFVASWTPRTYTVTYNWNGGVGSPTNPANYTVDGTAITLPTGTNTRDGYVFDGWQVAGTTTKLTSPYAPTANTLLEARWLDGAYVITFDASITTCRHNKVLPEQLLNSANTNSSWI
jgi:uncharacterized repeat protein (TIGR02543 family)